MELTAFNTKTSPTESLSGMFVLFDDLQLLVIHRDSRCGFAEAEKRRRLAKAEDLLGALEREGANTDVKLRTVDGHDRLAAHVGVAERDSVRQSVSRLLARLKIELRLAVFPIYLLCHISLLSKYRV